MHEHVHSKTTRRHEYRYKFLRKHRGGHGHAQWLLSVSQEEEFDIFDAADWLDLSDEDGNLYGAVKEGTDSLRKLGLYEEQIAKFWNRSNRQLEWHGFPVWTINHKGKQKQRGRSGTNDRPPKEVFDKMMNVGLIDLRTRLRLYGGHVV